MPGTLNEAGSPYNIKWGFIYLFNLIVGTGALTMPNAFDQAGWLISLVAVCLLAVMSYVTATFVIEVLASSNAALRLQDHHKQNDADESLRSDDLLGSHDSRQVLVDEDSPLLSNGYVEGTLGQDSVRLSANLFDISKRIEMGQMTSLFLPKAGIVFFYFSVVLYLYGDLTIYVVTVTKSMMNVACTYSPGNDSNIMCTDNVKGSLPCWRGDGVTRQQAYWIFLAIFVVTICPWVYFNIQKTKYLQIFTTLMRWIAFATMIALALYRLGEKRGEGHPPVGKVKGMPALFGVCVYSFMCHHSLPSIVAPVTNKRNIYKVFAMDYIIILIFYMLLSFSGIFAFANIRDLYTLNFLCDNSNHPITNSKFIMYFLALFPVLTLSSNFPIIGVSLRNNLKTLMASIFGRYEFPVLVDRIVFPTVVIIVPIAIGMITENVTTLVSITGSFAGSSIQYFIPLALAYCSRKCVQRTLQERGLEDLANPYTSPCRSRIWLLVVLVWAVTAVVFISIDRIQTWF